jgi:hypothetical protein
MARSKIDGKVSELLHMDRHMYSIKAFRRFLRNTEKKQTLCQMMAERKGETEILLK